MNNTNNKLGFVVTSVLAPVRAKHFMTYSRREGEKVNIVPGDIVPEAIEAAESRVYWDLQLKKMDVAK